MMNVQYVANIFLHVVVVIFLIALTVILFYASSKLNDAANNIRNSNLSNKDELATSYAYWAKICSGFAFGIIGLLAVSLIVILGYWLWGRFQSSRKPLTQQEEIGMCNIASQNASGQEMKNCEKLQQQLLNLQQQLQDLKCPPVN